MTQEEMDDYLHQLSDEDLCSLTQQAAIDLSEAAGNEPESEWHQACFAGFMALNMEVARRKQEVLH